MSKRLMGYAVKYMSPSEKMHKNGKPFMEMIRHGAFSEWLKKGDDTRAYYGHDPKLVLGRTSNGTLRLQDDPRGLRVILDLDDTTHAEDLYKRVKRGDVFQCCSR